MAFTNLRPITPNSGHRPSRLQSGMTDANGTSLAALSAFLIKLESAHIHYQMTSVRDGAVMVQIAVPGERWEIEFFSNRSPEIEVFRSDGSIEGESALDGLFAKHSE